MGGGIEKGIYIYWEVCNYGGHVALLQKKRVFA